MAKPPDPDKEETPTTPNAKRKPSTANNTPRRASATKKPSGPRTPNARKASVSKNATAGRKASANANGGKTPASAPARGGSKKEPTLLGDFLLGRPSPQRQRTNRRKSLEGVKMEMRAELVERVRPPGKVQDRVKQWQKAVEKPIDKEGLDEIVVEVEEDSTNDEAHAKRVNSDGKTPGKRKSPEEEKEKPRSKSAAAPKKRVISDSHWMKKPETEATKKISPPPKKVNRIPKDFLQTTAVNPPIEKKIEDWMGRTSGSAEYVVVVKHRSRRIDADKSETKNQRRSSSGQDSNEKPRSRNVSRQSPPDDGIRIQPEEETPTRKHKSRQQLHGLRDTLSKNNDVEDGIRIKPSKDRPDDDGIRITPKDIPKEHDTPTRRSRNRPSDDGIRIKSSGEYSPDGDMLRRDGSKQRPTDSSKLQTPRQRSEQHLRPPPPSESRRASSYGSSQMDRDDEEVDKFSWMSPSPPENSKRGNRKSGSPAPTDDIPFGNSAFSVLDLPVGAEAGTMRRPGPKRNNSFAAVPKVLKRVYTEGMKIVHDTPESARAGPNQPPSIDSWLNGTVDPFVDQSAAPVPGLKIPEHTSRRRSYKEDDRAERELTAELDEEREARRNRRSRKSPADDQQDGSPSTPKNRETLPSMENSPPISPIGLRRTPATRNVSSPKSARKIPLKEAIFDAFKGESAMRPKPGSPSPYDLIGLRERDPNRTPPECGPTRDLDSIDEDTPTQNTHRESVSGKARFEVPVDQPAPKPQPLFPRRPAPTTGVHRLSTIASVETFSTSSSASESTADDHSEISQTTVTQDTVFTGPTSSSLSRKSTKTGLKRRLTKHSDLLSVLSLPDAPQVERSKSVRSARSIRTTRRHLESATVQDLMRELADDEAKYLRELNTLVDGVIPVLLTSVLSKSDSAIAAGLLDADSETNSYLTKPIVDMGVALERLRSLHKRVSLEDSDAFLDWLQSAEKIYEDYLFAWRTGFEGVVVNLAPSHRDESSDLAKMPRNSNGDVINENGEVVDVAYLLKRPVVRVKYLLRVVKGLHNLKQSDLSKMRIEQIQKLEALCRRRAKEELARREDQRANNTDSTRARDLRTLAPIEGVKINRTRQVAAKDSFSFELPHSSGQKIECQIDMLLRDTPTDPKDADILIIEVDSTGRFLLFPPVDRNCISARVGDHDCQLVVMNRGIANKEVWSESFILETDEPDAAKYWLDVLGSVPRPPPIVRKEIEMDPQLASEISAATAANKSIIGNSKTQDDIPIGERRRRAEEEVPKSKQRRRSAQVKAPSTLHQCLKEDPSHSELGELCILDVKDLNEARAKAGSLPLTLPRKRPTPSRYHTSKSADVPVVMTGGLALPEENKQDPFGGKNTRDDRPAASFVIPHMPKVRSTSSPSTSEKLSSPLNESKRPAPETLKKRQSSTPTHANVPPPPPAHRSPTTPNTLKKTQVLETPTPKAKSRRTSSPLKHEWQPSDASGTSSSSSHSDSESDSYSDSSEDELEAIDSPANLPPAVVYRKPSPPESLYNLPNTSVAPSQSASQTPYRGSPVRQTNGDTKKTIARIFCWKEKGANSCWKDMWPEICSIVIMPGRIEAYEISAAHSSPVRNGLESPSSSDLNSEIDAGIERPLIALDLTPLVILRQSTSIDIEITSPPLSQSRLKCTGAIRFRTLTTNDCHFLYAAVHYARMNNAAFIKLEEERKFASYGTHAYQQAIAANTRRSFFGRQRSYRASTRAPQSDIASEQSGRSSSVATALKRLSGGGLFNIAKSSVDRGGPMSHSTSSSDYSGATPPGTPGSPSMAGSSAYSQMQDLGWEDIPIILSIPATHTKWEMLGAAFLTVSTPPPDMRPESSQNYGIPKRITISKKKLQMGSPQGPNPDALVMVDVVVGVGCFSLLARKGVLMHDWRDIRGNDGQIGVIGATGGVSATIGRYLFQTERGMARDWIWSLTGGLYDRRRGGGYASGYAA